MKISVVGTGYVGIVTAACFSELGNEVTCVDVVKEKVDAINAGKSTIYEPGLEKLIAKNVKAGRLRATTELRKAVTGSDLTFICVGTPSKESGETDLGYVKVAAEGIGKALAEKRERHIVVVKSTVPPGTSELVAEIIGKAGGKNFGVCMNPEFLREGSAVEDFMKPDRVVVGGADAKDAKAVAKLYAKLKAPVLLTNLRTAEMIKYASNAFLATKVSFINEIGNVCKRLGIDVYEVAKGMGYDKRISPHFLQAGAGFGGSCFPKDVSSLVYEARKLGYEPRLLAATVSINKEQPLKMIEMLGKRVGGVRGKTIGVLGLAFKRDTDDVRESPSLKVIGELLRRGARVVAYDPQASQNAKKIFPSLEYAASAAELEKKSDAVLVMADWKEFENFKTDKPVVDGRYIIKARGKNYEGLCW